MSFLSDEQLELLQEKHCKLCGTQRCHGMFDDFFREGCPYYVKANTEAKAAANRQTKTVDFEKPTQVAGML